MSQTTALISGLLVVNAILVAGIVLISRAFLRQMEKLDQAWRTELTELLAHQDRLLDRIQAPELVAAGAAVRMAPPRPKTPPSHKTIRGRGGVGVARIPIQRRDEDEPTEEMGG